MPTLLLVEDNEDSRDALARRLERRGYQLQLAGDGAEAISHAEARRFDLILMDMNLPLVDGWTATRTIRGTARNGRTPIIALTAHAMAGDREKTLAAGCNDHHAKPVRLPELLSQIEGLLAAGAATRP